MEKSSSLEWLQNNLSKINTEFILTGRGLCPDWQREPHRHMRDTVYLIIDGACELCVNGTTIYPKGGDAVLIPKNAQISFKSDNETCYNKYWCEFNIDIDGAPLFESLDCPYIISPEDFAYMRFILDYMDDLHLKNDDTSVIALKAMLIELVSLFLGALPSYEKKNLKKDYFSENLKAYIDTHLSEKLSAKGLALNTGYSEDDINEMFNRSFGTLPAKYISVRKIDRDKYEILYTNDQMNAIAKKVGYTINKLSSEFKAVSGITPLEFRKRYK